MFSVLNSPLTSLDEYGILYDRKNKTSKYWGVTRQIYGAYRVSVMEPHSGKPIHVKFSFSSELNAARVASALIASMLSNKGKLVDDVYLVFSSGKRFKISKCDSSTKGVINMTFEQDLSFYNPKFEPTSSDIVFDASSLTKIISNYIGKMKLKRSPRKLQTVKPNPIKKGKKKGSQLEVIETGTIDKVYFHDSEKEIAKQLFDSFVNGTMSEAMKRMMKVLTSFDGNNN